VPEAHLVGPVPRPFALKGKVDKLASLTHPLILYASMPERLIRRAFRLPRTRPATSPAELPPSAVAGLCPLLVS
jgi:hypothetical protein